MDCAEFQSLFGRLGFMVSRTVFGDSMRDNCKVKVFFWCNVQQLTIICIFLYICAFVGIGKHLTVAVAVAVGVEKV